MGDTDTSPAARPAVTKLRILSQENVRDLLELDPLLEALHRAFIELSAGRASVPPRVAATSPANGMLSVMPGYIDGVLEAKLVSIFSGNHDLGLPSHQALIVLFDYKTGRPLALMDGTHITAVRTGAASALAIQTLARPDAHTLAILGAGVQGAAHLMAVTRVRRFDEVRISSRTMSRARTLAASYPGARVVESFEDAVKGADVVCACTDAPQPVILVDWVQSGATVTSVGGSRGGPELDPALAQNSHLVVESRATAFQPFPAGAQELRGLNPERATELGEILAGERPGRRSTGEIIVYKSTGHAIEDAVAARLVFERSLENNVGELVAT